MLSLFLSLLSAASTDSVAPAPLAPSVAPVSSPAALAPAAIPSCPPGPLKAGSWGLGFRVLGSSPQVRLRRAVDQGLAIGLNLSWWGDYELTPTTNTHREQNHSSGDSGSSTYQAESEEERTRIDLRAELPLEWHRSLPHGLHLVTSLGPFYMRSQMEAQFDAGSYGSDEGHFSKDESYDNRIGLAGSLGVAWEFVPGLCLASSFGADVYKSWGETYSSVEPYGKELTWASSQYRKSSSSGFGTATWFGGIGLDLWF